jgi:hypothetical protein
MIGFNGTGLMLPPTTAGWIESDLLGTSGDGHGIYPAIQQFQMTFNLTSQQEWYELQAYFNRVSVTGTLVASLPDPTSSTFAYRNFSGVTLRKPTMTEYFSEEWSSEVKLVLLVRV